MTRTSVGELEHLVLLAIGRLQPAAYAVNVVEEIETHTGRDLGHASIYVVLGRLEDKGYLTSRLGEPADERGGRPRRFYRLTPQAVGELRARREGLLALWDGLEIVSTTPASSRER